MANYSIRFSATAKKQLVKLDKKTLPRVVKAINNLSVEPRPAGARKLQGYDDWFRIRVSNYRIIYAIQDKELVVVVFKVGHRKDIYRQL